MSRNTTLPIIMEVESGFVSNSSYPSNTAIFCRNDGRNTKPQQGFKIPIQQSNVGLFTRCSCKVGWSRWSHGRHLADAKVDGKSIFGIEEKYGHSIPTACNCLLLLCFFSLLQKKMHQHFSLEHRHRQLLLLNHESSFSPISPNSPEIYQRPAHLNTT